MGRPTKPGTTFVPTEEQRRQVHTMTGFGIRQEDLCTVLQIDAKTLRKHFRRELDTGIIEANARVAQSLYKNAVVDGNVAAQIWWTKTRMGWKEPPTVHEHIDSSLASATPEELEARLDELRNWRRPAARADQAAVPGQPGRLVH